MIKPYLLKHNCNRVIMQSFDFYIAIASKEPCIVRCICHSFMKST